MTNEEATANYKYDRAIDLIRRIKTEETHERKIDRHKAFDLAISALEKQIPKKPIPHIVNAEKIKTGNGYCGKGTTIYYCPNCKDFISRMYTYCHKCGQKLLWE